MKQPKVFLSYSKLDTQIIMRVYDQLQAIGIICWIDRFGIGQNEILTDEVERALIESDAILCYLSSNSMNSEWVNLELKRAKDFKKEVFYFIDNDNNRAAIPTSLLKETIGDIANRRIPVLDNNPDIFYPSILEFISKFWGSIHKIRYKHIEADEILGPANAIGLYNIKYGKFEKRDDDKLGNLIRSSENIKFLGFNGSAFVMRFIDDFYYFFNKKNTTMQVLMAKPQTEFYDENTYLVSKVFHRNPDDWSSIVNTRMRLKSYCLAGNGNKTKSDYSKVSIRHFNTQLRGVMFIFDDKLCQYTLNLPPVESFNSIMLEFKTNGESDQLINSLLRHYNAIWDVSEELPDAYFQKIGN